MRNSMHTTPMALLLNDTPNAPGFPVTMLGLQRADIAVDVLRMAALWSDDQTSSDAALWADNWPIVN